MKPLIRRCFILALSFFGYFFAIEISFGQTYPDLFFTNITEKNGLSSNRTYKIIRDHEGFMWFATDNGLNRFDGNNMKVYKNIPGDSSSLLNNFVTTVFEDSKNNLWIGTTDAISMYDREHDNFIHFIHHEKDSSSISIGEIKCFLEDDHNQLWISSTGGGLNLFNREKKIFVHYYPSPVQIKNSSFQKLVRLGKMIPDRDGSLWVGSFDGLSNFNPADGRFKFFVYKPDDIPGRSFNNLVTSVLQDNTNPDIIWYGTWGSGLHRFNKKTKNIEAFKYRFKAAPNLSNIVFDIAVRDDSTLWITSENGLGVFNKQTQQFFFYQHQPDNEHSLVSNSVNCISADATGLTWIGSVNGISIIDPNLQHFRFKELAVGSGNNNFIFDSKRNKIYSTTIYSNRCLSVYDCKTEKLTRFPIPHADEMKSEPFGFFLDGRGIIWIGTTKTGVYEFNPLTSQFTKLETEKPLHVPDASLYINGFFEDREENIWMSSYGYGMIEYKRKLKTFVRFCDDVAAPYKTRRNNCIKVFSDSNGNIWAAFKELGLSKYDVKKDSVVSYDYTDNKYYSKFHELSDVVIDAGNRIWIASNTNGLICFDEQQPPEKSVVVFNSGNKFPGNTLLSLALDNNNNLWVSHNEGVIFFNTKTVESKNFSAADGLPANNINASLYNPGNGDIWFPYKSGYYYFRPGDFKKDTVAPEIVLNSFKIFDNDFSAGKNPSSLSAIDLKHTENFISFEFSALNFTDPSGVRYAYKLDGVDGDWVYSGARRFASYTDLTPGKYVLHIKAANSDGVWNERGKSIRIVIHPAWWQTPWFKLLIALVTTVAVWAGIKWYTRRRLKTLELELKQQKEIQNIRTRISRDIHDEIGAGLTKISLMSRSFIRADESELQKKNTAEKISLESQNLISSLGEIVWEVNPANDSLQSLLAYSRHYCGNLFENTAVHLHLDFPALKEVARDRNMNPDIKRNFILILKESLNNILKHADAKNVFVTLKTENNYLELIIRDDGSGFSADNVPVYGNGLKNMKKRAEEIHAHYETNSEKGKGTTSVLKVSII